MNKAEFEHIAKDLRLRALSVGRSYGLDADAAEDLAQDTMLKVWALRERLQPDPSVLSFASRVAVNLCISQWRKARTVPIGERRIIDDHHPAPDTALETSENDAWLQRQLQALPTKEHQVLRLRQVEQKTNAEIAAILGIEQSSVATLLSRARHRLLDEFRRRSNERPPLQQKLQQNRHL